MILPRKIWLAAGVIAVCGWHLLLRRSQLSLPLMRDEGEYAYMARTWSDGGLPYRDAYCQKPPMIFVLYRIAYALDPGDVLAPRKLMVAFSWATMLLLFAMTPSSWPLVARLCAPAAFGAASTWPIGSLSFAANTEIFICAFFALSGLALLRSRESERPQLWAALSGLAAGAALMTKQTSLMTAAGFGFLWWMAGRRRRASALVYGASLLIVPALFFSFFLWNGAFGDFWRDVYTRNMDYARVVLASGSLPSQAAWFARAVTPLFLRAGWPLFALAAYALWDQPVAWDSCESVAVIWLGTGVAGALTGFLLFPYYFLQAFPALALMTAAGARRLARLGRGAATAALAIVCLYPGAAFFGSYFRQTGPELAATLLSPNPIYEAQRLGLFLRERTLPSDRLYVFGSEAQIYVYAERRAATPYIFCYPLTMFPKDQAAGAAEVRNLEDARPRFVVYSTQKGSTIISGEAGMAFARAIRRWLDSDYRLVGLMRLGQPDGGALETVSSAAVPWDEAPALLIFERRG